MPYCHFSRVFVGTTLWDLKANNENQVSQNCKKIEYMELTCINLQQSEFDILCRDISKPQHCYQKYALESRANSSGNGIALLSSVYQANKKLSYIQQGTHILFTLGFMNNQLFYFVFFRFAANISIFQPVEKGHQTVAFFS